MPGGAVLILLGGMGAIALPVIGEMIFGLLGVTPEDPTWGLVWLLGGLWAMVAGRLPGEWRAATGQWPSLLGWMMGLITGRIKGRIKGLGGRSRGKVVGVRFLTGASRVAGGALLGFFYGGRWTGDDLRGAIAGLLLGLILSLGGGLWLARRWPRLERVMGGAIAFWAAYGLWFWLGAWGLSALMAGRWGFALLYGWAALNFGQWVWLGGSLLWGGGLGLPRGESDA